MNFESRIYQILLIIGAFAAAILPVGVGLKIFQTQAPTKSISVSEFYADPLESLASIKDKAELKLSVGEFTYNNLIVANVTIVNGGASPIVDADIKVPITAKVAKGWKIVAVGDCGVGDRSSPRAITWEKNISGESIVASTPFLMNPSETYSFPVYLTRNLSEKVDRNISPLQWTARIVGLANFERNIYSQLPGAYPISPVEQGFQIILTSKAIVYLFFIAFPLACFFIYLLQRNSQNSRTNLFNLFPIIGVCFVSIALADVAVTYINPSNTPVYSTDPAHWANFATVLFGFALAIFLYFRPQNNSLKVNDAVDLSENSQFHKNAVNTAQAKDK